MKRLASISGLATIVIAALIATQATGDTSKPSQQSETTRAAGYLAATQRELADTNYALRSIRLEHRVDGREIYSLRGRDAWCILVAGAAQATGHSESLSCVDANASSAGRHMVTGFEPASGHGYVDLVWSGGGTPKNVTADSSDVDIRAGTDVIAAIRADDATNRELRWTEAGGASAHVDLLSRDARQARAHAAFASQASR